jgi:TldD protein
VGWTNNWIKGSINIFGSTTAVFLRTLRLTEHDLERYLSAALSAGGDYADLYFEYLSSTSLMVDESMVKSASQGISAGCGVRVVSGERTGYAYTDDLSSGRILRAARTAALIASAPAKTPRWRDFRKRRRGACIR